MRPRRSCGRWLAPRRRQCRDGCTAVPEPLGTGGGHASWPALRRRRWLVAFWARRVFMEQEIRCRQSTMWWLTPGFWCSARALVGDVTVTVPLRKKKTSDRDGWVEHRKKSKSLATPSPDLMITDHQQMLLTPPNSVGRDQPGRHCNLREQVRPFGSWMILISHRISARYGLRGARVGEATHPGPPRIRVLLACQSVERGAHHCRGDVKGG